MAEPSCAGNDRRMSGRIQSQSLLLPRAVPKGDQARITGSKLLVPRPVQNSHSTLSSEVEFDRPGTAVRRINSSPISSTDHDPDHNALQKATSAPVQEATMAPVRHDTVSLEAQDTVISVIIFVYSHVNSFLP